MHHGLDNFGQMDTWSSGSGEMGIKLRIDIKVVLDLGCFVRHFVA